jgi:hypothetical protein
MQGIIIRLIETSFCRIYKIIPPKYNFGGLAKENNNFIIRGCFAERSH